MPKNREGKTEEERLMLLQQRSRAEEEMKKKKEEILTLFLEVLHPIIYHDIYHNQSKGPDPLHLLLWSRTS